MSPLKLLFLIAVAFNCKMMQFLLICFYFFWQGFKIVFFFLLFLPGVPFFSGVAYKYSLYFCFLLLHITEPTG